MRKTSAKMLWRRVINVAAALTAAQEYLSQVLADGQCSQSASCSVLQAIKDAAKAAVEMQVIAMRIWHKEKQPAKKVGK